MEGIFVIELSFGNRDPRCRGRYRRAFRSCFGSHVMSFHSTPQYVVVVGDGHSEQRRRLRAAAHRAVAYQFQHAAAVLHHADG